MNECTTTRPCRNGATCVNKNGGYDCLCVPGFKGKNCEIGKEPFLKMIFFISIVTGNVLAV